MAYSSGGLIEATDYNLATWGTNAGGTYTSVATAVNLAYIHGIGYGRYGYGQSTSNYTQVVANSLVTAPQWTGALNGINAALGLQGATLITPGSVATGDVITYYSSITSGIATANTNASTGTVGSRSSTGWTGTGINYQDGTTGWGGSTNRIGRFTITCTWASGDLARYWWNCGGTLDLSYSVSPTTGTTRIADWNTLLTACGTTVIGYNTTTKSGGSGSTDTLRSSVGTGGYWLGTAIAGNHPGTTTLQFKQLSANAPYNTDFVSVSAVYSGTTTNGAYPILTLTVDFVNTYQSTFQQTVGAIPRVTMLVNSPVATALSTAPTAPTVTASFSDI
jgi:hypothetical protein